MKKIYAPWRSAYLRGAKTTRCLFCELVKKKAGSKHWILHKGEHWYVIINAFPYTSGHMMIVCGRHVEKFPDLTLVENTELMPLLASCEDALRNAYNPDGINMGANLGKSAGAGIEGHLHVHLVPRWQGDTNFFTSVGEARVISEDLTETYDRLKEYF